MKNHGLIALITDFGNDDHYAGVVKGVIKGINSGAEIVDVSHGVRSFSIINAQFILHASFQYFPEQTIFYVVVDPGVGTARGGIIASDDRYQFVLPDNGIISAVERDSMKYWTIDMTRFPRASSTFHGRDVFAPVAAGLSLGRRPEEYGNPMNTSPVRVRFPEYSLDGPARHCMIVHVDRFGNAVTSLPNDEFDFVMGSRHSISGERYHFDTMCSDTYGSMRDMPGLMQGSSGFIELAADRDSLSDRFGVRVEDELTILPVII